MLKEGGEENEEEEQKDVGEYADIHGPSASGHLN